MLATSVAPTEPVGFCIGNDQYFKRDDVGIIYQLNVAPGNQRAHEPKLIAAARELRDRWLEHVNRGDSALPEPAGGMT